MLIEAALYTDIRPERKRKIYLKSVKFTGKIPARMLDLHLTLGFQMIKTRLRDKTVSLLQNRSVKLTYKKISADTTIPVGWIKMLAADLIAGPDVNRIETLYEYLTKKELEL